MPARAIKVFALVLLSVAICFAGKGGVVSVGSGSTGATVYTNVSYSNGTCTTAVTIDPAHGNVQEVTLTNAQTCTLTFVQPASSTVRVQIKITQSTSGSFNGTISGGKWPAGGAVPTITATSGAVDFISCYLDGTNAYCVATQNFQ